MDEGDRLLTFKYWPYVVDRAYLPPPSPLPAVPPQHPSTGPTPPQKAMAKDYEKLWKGVTSATNEAQAVWALAQIVFDKQGRAFTLDLKLEDAELCVEILDYVSCDLCLPPRLRRLRRPSPGYHRAEPQTRREERVLPHAETTCRTT